MHPRLVLDTANKARMAGHYLTSVAKQLSNKVPEDFAFKSHHVLGSNGSISKFRNIHPSWDPLHDSSSVFPILMKVVRYALSPIHFKTQRN